MELQVILNTYATDIFRKQADCDYISARSNFRLRLRQQFLWSAQHAIEKYLKAILLYNGKSARYHQQAPKKEFRHDLTALVQEVKSITIFTFQLDSTQDTFLAYLAQQGPNRYIGKTAYNPSSVLRDLDHTTWHIRRYCQFMEDISGGAAPGARQLFIDAALHPSVTLQPHKFALRHGELEKVLKRARTDPARKALVWANTYYGAKKRSVITYDMFSSIEVPPKEREWQNVDWAQIENYVKL
jgi:HEPN domain-containing protein